MTNPKFAYDSSNASALPFLPYGRQAIDADDIAAVTEVLTSDMLTCGPKVAEFEQAFARVVGAPEAIACSSGTAALHLTYAALGVGPGDIVVVPAITFLATANAARFLGADIVFADVDPQTGLMTPDTLKAAIETCDFNRIKAITPVHFGGQPADVTAIADIAQSLGAMVVEDCCHALGSVRQGREGFETIGASRDSAASVFSLHPVKTIAAGEGGMVATRDKALAARLRALRNHAVSRDASQFEALDIAFDDGTPNPWHYEMTELGFNYRLSDIACALGRSQLRKLGRFAARRQKLASLYDRALADLAPLLTPAGRTPGSDPAPHLYPVLIDFTALGKSRRQVMEALKAHNVGTQVHYIPVNRQPYYARLGAPQQLEGADRWFSRTLSLPLFPAMTDQDVARVSGALHMVLADS